MLDTDVDRVRTERLREFIEEQKREADAERTEAVDWNSILVASEKSGAIDAYDEILRYLDARSGDEFVRLRMNED